MNRMKSFFISIKVYPKPAKRFEVPFAHLVDIGSTLAIQLNLALLPEPDRFLSVLKEHN